MASVITINENEYKIDFTFNTLSEFEQAYGKPISEAVKDARIDTMILLFQFSLRMDKPKITKKQAGDLLTAYTKAEGGAINELFEMIGNACAELMGDKAPPSDE